LAGGTGAGRSPNNCARAGIADSTIASAANAEIARRWLWCAAWRRAGLGAVTMAVVHRKAGKFKPCKDLAPRVSRFVIQNWHPSPDSHIFFRSKERFCSAIGRFGGRS
jgi:hypothetical protein